MYELLLSFLNFVDMFFNIFVLIALLLGLYFQKVIVSYKDGMLVIVLFILFFSVGISMLKSMVSFNIKQNHVEKKIEHITHMPFLVSVNNVLCKDQERAKKIIKLFSNIYEGYAHRGKNTAKSKPSDQVILIHLWGEKEELHYRLYQDNGRDYEYWVYENNTYIGRIETTLFLESVQVKEIEKQLTLKEEQKNKRKNIYILIIASVLILSIIMQTVFLSDSFSGKDKQKFWKFFIPSSWLLGVGLLSVMDIDGLFFFLGITFFALSAWFSVSFCEACGAWNSGEKSFKKLRYCKRCEKKI